MTQESDMTDTDRVPLDGLKRDGERRHRFWRFDPTVSSGTLLQLLAGAIALGAAYATYREDRATTAAEIALVKITAVRDREEMVRALASISGDMKELKTKLDGVGENVAVLKGQSATPITRR